MARKISNLLGWWKFDNDLIDSSSNPTDGTWVGTPLFGTGKQFTNAAQFDTTNYVDVTGLNLVSVQNISFWFNPSINDTNIIDLNVGTNIISINASNQITTDLTNAVIMVNNQVSSDLILDEYSLISISFDGITLNDMTVGNTTNSLIGDLRLYGKKLDSGENTAIYNNGNGNIFNDLTRIIYELQEVEENDLVQYSEINLKDDKNINVGKFGLNSFFDINMSEAVNFYDYRNINIYSGEVRYINNMPLQKDVQIFNYEVLLSDELVTDVFTNIQAEDLIQLLVETYSELTYDSSYVSGITIERYSATNKSPRKIILDILSRLPGVTYIVSNEKVFTLFEIGSITSSLTLENGVNSNINVSGWVEDDSKQVTSLLVIGETQNPERTETFTATPGQTDFNLQDIPETIEIRVDGVQQQLQVDGQNTGDFTNEVTTRLIQFVNPLAGGESVEIKYNYELNIQAQIEADFSLVQEFGIKKDEITRYFLTTEEDAREYGTRYIEKWAIPTITTNIAKIDSADLDNLAPSSQILVIDNINKVRGENINDNFIIRSVSRKYPTTGSVLTIEVGENKSTPIDFFQESNYNLIQLYEQYNSNSFLNVSQLFRNSIELVIDTEIVSVTRRTYDVDTFYLEDGDEINHNRMRDDGSGDIMRDQGYTEDPIN